MPLLIAPSVGLSGTGTVGTTAKIHHFKHLRAFRAFEDRYGDQLPEFVEIGHLLGGWCRSSALETAMNRIVRSADTGRMIGFEKSNRLSGKRI
jgi:hypothetical protein